MIEVATNFPGTLRNCECGRQPKRLESRGRIALNHPTTAYACECAPCRIRTARFATTQEAVQAWEDGQTQSFAQRGVAA